MKSWFRTLVGRSGAASKRHEAIDLLVVEGSDTGQQFTIDGDDMPIGRRAEHEERTRGVFLHDPTISAHQATIRRQAGGFVLHHQRNATNPTRIDGKPAQVQGLRAGSRIQMGRTTLEVRVNQGIGLSNLTQFLSEEGSDATTAAGYELSRPKGMEATTELVTPSRSADRTESVEREPSTRSQVGYLVVLHGFDSATTPGARFAIWSDSTRLGRGQGMEIQLADLGISREHAELVFDEGELHIVHHSAVNPTFLNGRQISNREVVHDGDQIQLSGRVGFQVELPHAQRESSRYSDENTMVAEVSLGPSSLHQEMERKVALEQSIEDRYRVTGSFLDVDVVNSYGMKAAQSQAEYIIVSFERFRSYIAEIVTEHRGLVLNSNGDELMCYFESSRDAVQSGAAILSRLDDFNGDQNLLQMPFCFRIGVHTGESLVDLDRGVAYSVILDVAGHLQKEADSNAMVVSEATLKSLDSPGAFELAGRLEREGLDYFRLVGSLD